MYILFSSISFVLTKRIHDKGVYLRFGFFLVSFDINCTRGVLFNSLRLFFSHCYLFVCKQVGGFLPSFLQLEEKNDMKKLHLRHLLILLFQYLIHSLGMKCQYFSNLSLSFFSNPPSLYSKGFVGYTMTNLLFFRNLIFLREYYHFPTVENVGVKIKSKSAYASILKGDVPSRTPHLRSQNHYPDIKSFRGSFELKKRLIYFPFANRLLEIWFALNWRRP